VRELDHAAHRLVAGLMCAGHRGDQGGVRVLLEDVPAAVAWRAIFEVSSLAADALAMTNIDDEDIEILLQREALRLAAEEVMQRTTAGSEPSVPDADEPAPARTSRRRPACRSLRRALSGVLCSIAVAIMPGS